MKNSIKLIIYYLLDILGINVLCRYKNRKKSLILLYHGICDDDFTLLKGYDDRQLPVSIFKKQLNYLKRKGYIFVNMTELISSMKNRNSSRKMVAITFDDGFVNVFRNAYPIMKDAEAKGCLYLVSGLVGNNQLLWTDHVETAIRNQSGSLFHIMFQGEEITYNLSDRKSSQKAMLDIKAKLRSLPDAVRNEHMTQFLDIRLKDVPAEFRIISWEEVRKLDINTLEIGSHTRLHPNCVNLSSDEEMEDEILGSKNEIENNTDFHVSHFCYPAGSYDQRVIEKTIESGYESAVTTKPGFNDCDTDYFQMKRIEAPHSFVSFKADISGSHNLLRGLKEILGK